MAKRASNPLFEKLSPAALSSLGLSSKSERYKNISTGNIISKRQYQKTLESRQRNGSPISNEKLAKEYKENRRQYSSEQAKKAAIGRTRQSSGVKNYQHYVKALLDAGKNPNTKVLRDSQKLNAKAWKKLTESDGYKLANIEWGKVARDESGHIILDENDMPRFPFMVDLLDEEYPDDDLSPFFYH